jgi:drug/metabolite transporter (DMT)-like permease
VGRLRPYFPELALVLASVLYGSSFILVQRSLDDVTPAAFNVMRFGLATIVLAPFALRRDWRGPSPRPTDGVGTLLAVGAGLGLLGVIAYQAENVGLDHTTTSNAGFITGLFVVFTPLIAAVRYRRPPRPRVAASVAISVLGLFLLTGASLHLRFGDAVTLITALAWSVWLVATGEVARRFDPFPLVLVQAAVGMLGALVITAFSGFGEITPTVLVAVLVTGVGCSAIGFSLSTWAQRVVEPERAGVINLLEPVVVGVVGFAVGERLGVLGYLGAGLILLSIAVVERGTHPDDVTGANEVTGVTAQSG